MALNAFDLKKTAATLGELLDYARDHSCCLEVLFEDTYAGKQYRADLKPRTNPEKFGDNLEKSLSSLLEHMKPIPAKIPTVYDPVALVDMFEQIRKANGVLIFYADFRKPSGNVFSCSVAPAVGSLEKAMGNDAGLTVFTAMAKAGI